MGSFLQQRGQRAAIYASHKSRLMNRIEVQVSERINVYLPTLKVSGSNPALLGTLVRIMSILDDCDMIPFLNHARYFFVVLFRF